MAVTFPLEETVATDFFDEVHLTFLEVPVILSVLYIPLTIVAFFVLIFTAASV